VAGSIRQIVWSRIVSALGVANPCLVLLVMAILDFAISLISLLQFYVVPVQVYLHEDWPGKFQCVSSLESDTGSGMPFVEIRMISVSVCSRS
jgi:hypothetical protein